MKRLTIMLAACVLAACRGGSDEDGDEGGPPPPSPPPAQTATGVFRDTVVAGLTYTSGSQSGTTRTDGVFVYEVGQQVTFRVGGVTIGSTAGRSLVTPIDLVANGSSSSPAVLNVVRFLLMLDTDGDPRNGIGISDSVRARAGQWSAVDFTSTDLGAALATITADARSADGGAHVLPDAAAARAHLEATFRCAYSGALRGTFSGGDTGRFGMLVFTNGLTFGIGYSTADHAGFTTSGATPISIDRNTAFVAGTTSSGASYSGRFAGPDSVSGTWSNGPDTGSFSGTRIGGLPGAMHRFTGGYVETGGGDAGLFAFDVSAADQISGIAYSVVDDELVNLSGSVSGTTLTAMTSTGISISGTLERATGALSGTYSGAGGAGRFTGVGCRLN